MISSQASIIQMDIGPGDALNNGGHPSSTQAPWIRATFSDTSTSGTVLMVLEALNLSGKENVKDWAFNLNPDLRPSSLVFTHVTTADASAGSFKLPSISKGNQNTQGNGLVPGGKSFDILFSFTPGGVVKDTFTKGDKVSYLISGNSTLDATDFAFTDKSGNYYSVAHFQNTLRYTGGTSGKRSADDFTEISTVPVPEPSTIVAGLLLLIPVAVGLGKVRKVRTP
ncbi:MAG TPA: hypothetical protein VEC99_07370 [Clostridia bacterium]|nr:hypothetical protein [Clostridia bacterium]